MIDDKVVRTIDQVGKALYSATKSHPALRDWWNKTLSDSFGSDRGFPIATVIAHTFLRRIPGFSHEFWTTATEEQEREIFGSEDFGFISGFAISPVKTIETFTFAEPGEPAKTWRHILFFSDRPLRYRYSIVESPPYPKLRDEDPRETAAKRAKKFAEVNERFDRQAAWKRRVESATSRAELLAIGEYPHKYRYLDSYREDPEYYPAAIAIWEKAVREIDDKAKQAFAAEQEAREVEALRAEIRKIMGDSDVLVQIPGQPRGAVYKMVSLGFIFGDDLNQLLNQSKYALSSTLKKLQRGSEPGDYIPIAKFGDRPPVAVMEYANTHSSYLRRDANKQGWICAGGVVFDNDGQRLRKGTKRYKEIAGE